MNHVLTINRKNIMKTVLFALVLVFASMQSCLAQSDEIAYVHMHGRDIHLGIIVEDEPGSHILLQTPMGQILLFRYSDIKKIEYRAKPEELRMYTRSVRSPLLAGFLSAVLPGTGQAYNGEYGKAFLYPGGIVLCAAIGGAGFLSSFMSDNDTGAVIAVLGAAGVVTFWVLGIIDAVSTAKSKARFGAMAASFKTPTSHTTQLATGQVPGGTALTFSFSLPF
jgi:hypothetical protein